MKNKKIINDPVHGFITIPYDSIRQLIEHPYVQRLRRIKQLGMTDYVYPGAVHTRFHHALGAMHLMTEALRVLMSKDIVITEEECEAACAAILLHDIGHGPFSHALETLIIPLSHEDIGLILMQKINEEMGGKLDLTLEIFKGTYHKKFLHQLVSSQLDMDRMDYLTRDSFYTGVTEGLIGHARLIKMLNVIDDQLVVEEKAIHSIEKFLHARHFMYWQVYLHKAVLSTEIMLRRLFSRMKEIYTEKDKLLYGSTLSQCLQFNGKTPSDKWIETFVQLDDSDILYAIKHLRNHGDFLLQLLSFGLQERQLFKLTLHNDKMKRAQLKEERLQSVMNPNLDQKILQNLIVTGTESTTFYESGKEEIHVLTKTNDLKRFSEMRLFYGQVSSKMYFVSFPTNELIDKYVYYQTFNNHK